MLKELWGIDMGSYYYKRLVREAKQISPHIRFKPIRYGFVRIYYQGAYIGECHKNMTLEGYDITEKDYRLDSYTDFQEYHDTIDSTARLKNFREGYVESLDKLRTRVYMFRKDREFYKRAKDGYKTLRIK
jgi:hypothetical protein